tara:strand:+ start:304 stop:1029 length:726 start_codon:yes stop_codon:yes gene_type:complete
MLNMFEKLRLNKKVYGKKEALEALDEEFTEFGIPSTNIKLFFNYYNKFFYDLSSNTHESFIHQSVNYVYPDGFIHPLRQELEELKAQKIDVQKQIDSVIREHAFFKNNIFLMDVAYKNNPTSVLQNGEALVYIMQSGKKRKITNYQVYVNLRNKKLPKGSELTDKDIIVFVENGTLQGIPSSWDINTIEDIALTPLKINIYPRTIEEYEEITDNTNLISPFNDDFDDEIDQSTIQGAYTRG